ILARTIKGYGLGPGFAGRNTTHQKKKADIDAMMHMRDMIGLEFTNDELESYPFVEPGMMPEIEEYMKQRREKLGGPIPERIDSQKEIIVQPKIFSEFDGGTKGTLEVSTTMAFVKILRGLMKDKEVGSQVVLIIPDEARTFGMDPLFSEFGIYHPEGQLYKPVDHKTLMKYKVSNEGQIIQAGINEAGAMSTFIASAMSYATAGIPTIPFYTFYSMFGFQRVADLIWAAADGRARGFLMGATSGRTTLNGEGLQHQDGHSLLMAHTNPAVKAWDPAFAYEIAAIIKHGINEMYVENKDIINYIALYNENYSMPEIPKEVDEKDILNGIYLYKEFQANEKDSIESTVDLLGSGPIMQQVLKAAEILSDRGIKCRVWSVTSYGELYRKCSEFDRVQRLTGYQSESVYSILEGSAESVVVAASDNIQAVPELIRPWVLGRYIVLGTDGFGRSDTRTALRRFFEVDSEHIVLAALAGLVQKGTIDIAIFDTAKQEFGIEVEREDVTNL
ncbi:MAG: pyruvate dehydrogenase (acetyl-transferring), homodimeric type, partial [Candidatus Thermoplasmatota archaeon]|nr:pyruvate dehydrogenase (acetyl-transferring), homodimeric type [Candidatus Thermoplasmatota archaeon]